MNRGIMEYHRYNEMFEVFDFSENSIILKDGQQLNVLNQAFKSIHEARESLTRRGGVYCWLNMQTKQIYIGSSTNIWQRFRAYKLCLQGKTSRSINKLFSNSLKKYGTKYFRFLILEFIDDGCKAVRNAEQRYLDKYRPFYEENGFNFLKKTDGYTQPTNRRGNENKGEASAAAILSNEDIIYIKEKLVTGVTLKVLADKFGVSTTVISNVKVGKTWGHIKASDEIEEKLKTLTQINKKGKISKELVLEIKERLKNENYRELAKELNMPETTIHGIKMGYRYKNLLGNE